MKGATVSDISKALADALVRPVTLEDVRRGIIQKLDLAAAGRFDELEEMGPHLTDEQKRAREQDPWYQKLMASVEQEAI